MSENITFIGRYAFDGCKNLTSITIPASVISIGERAFYNCPSLKTVMISRDTQLGKEAFSGFENIFYHGEKIPKPSFLQRIWIGIKTLFAPVQKFLIRTWER
jgi:hypothetical protein